MKKNFSKQSRKVLQPKLLTWKLNDQDVVNNFKEKLNNLLESERNVNLKSVEDLWKYFMTKLLKNTSSPVYLKMVNDIRRDDATIVQSIIQ